MTKQRLILFIWVTIVIFVIRSIIVYIDHNDVVKLVSDLTMAVMCSYLNDKYQDK